MTRIRLPNGTEIRLPDESDDDPDVDAFVQSRLAGAHKKKSVHCLCKPAGQRELVVHRRIVDARVAGAPNYRFHVARRANDGPNHADGCRFFAPDEEVSGRGAYQAGVLRETDDGWSVRLPDGLLADRDPQDLIERPSPPRRKRPGRRTQSHMTLLGLLHLLWEEAQLNIWPPERANYRGWIVANTRLRETAETIRASGLKLHEVLAVISPDIKPAWSEVARATLGECRKRKRRAIMIGEATMTEFGLYLRMPKSDKDEDRIKLRISRAISDSSIASFPHAMRIIDRRKSLAARARGGDEQAKRSLKNEARVVAIAVCDPMPDEVWAARSVSLMEVNYCFLPIASAYEQRVADALVAARRCFRKPLRFDATNDLVFPDFELFDGGSRIAMEVYGLATETYERRREEKHAYYVDEYQGRYWYWIAASSNPAEVTKDPPPFP